MEPIARNEDYTSYIDKARLPEPQRAQSLYSDDYNQMHSAELFKMHFTQVEFGDGDTLVFIDFPDNKDKRQVDCHGVPFLSQKFRVHSEKLLATGSSKFADMFQPTYQFRILRRRKLVNQLPEGVKYVVDLTPPSEGDEMVFQITELSLTPGIIKWWSSYARLSVPFYLVKGHDDVCPCRDLTDRSMTTLMTEPVPATDVHEAIREAQENPSPVMLPLTISEIVSARNCGKTLQVVDVPPHFNIPDYCPIRHRNGIIRLLTLIEGKEVLIDSAPRLWTLVALAKIWDCVDVVQDRAIQWLMQGNNSKFVEVLPEEAIRIGGIIENATITRNAFRILVNELAFEQTATEKARESIDFSHVTMFGRRKGDPGDEFSNLIQHAALAFVERISKLLAELEGGDFFEAWNLPQYQKLLNIEAAAKHENPDRCKYLISLIKMIKVKFRNVLSTDVENLKLRYYTPHILDRNQVDADRATYVEPQDFQEFPEIYGKMTPLQKLLTRYPYKQFEHSWENWNEYNIGKGITECSAAAIIQSLGGEVDQLWKLWDEERETLGVSDEFFKVLLENWDPADYKVFPSIQMRLDVQVKQKLDTLGVKLWDRDQDLQIVASKHLLLTLTSNETKFLPLWAGGLNDGTGGVFEDQLPPAEMGPNGPGPAYHTGMTIPSDASSLSGSFVDDLSAMNMAGSTTAASVDVHDSVSTIYRPDHVIADDKSIASESFKSDFNDYHEARDQVEGADTKKEAVAQTLDEFLQGCDSDSDSTATLGNDDFDDLGDDEDDDLDMFSEPGSAAGKDGPEADMVLV